MTRTIPLFPLGQTVLFPGSTINLHIFEERYRLMIGRCLAENIPFGVVLLRQGEEVVEGRLLTEAAVPHEVGTTAEISANVQLEDGRYILTAVGHERFRVVEVVESLPYIVANVELLADDQSSASEPAIQALRALYDQYWRAMATATGAAVEPEELPIDATEMTFYLADKLQVVDERKQRWLEADTKTRLRDMTAMLRAELSLLPTSDAGQTDGWSGFSSLN